MSEERVAEYYKGFQIVTAFYKGEYQSRGHHKFANKLEAKQCNGISDAIEKIKKKVDEEVNANIENIQKSIIENHKQVMIDSGRNYLGVRSITSFRRINNCYSCKRSVDNAYDIECAACGWIICSNCSSCGCGYVGYF